MVALNKELNETKLPDRRAQLESRIKYTDKKIDEMVYKLYGLNKEEIKIIEGENNFKPQRTQCRTEASQRHHKEENPLCNSVNNSVIL